MDSRERKYSEDNKMSRVSRNNALYKEINNSELDNFSVKSNATVIGNQDPEIDIEKIKKILDMKYNSAPKRKSIRVEPREYESKVEDDVPTKEYDLNVFLERAKDDNAETYEEARAKKLRNTQFDILNNLNINEKEKIDEEEEQNLKSDVNKAEEDLMELINTITINEAKVKEIHANESADDVDPLSILEDLKGSEDTAVYEKMTTEVNMTAVENLEDEQANTEKNDEKIDDSFYTNSLFKKKDFEDDDDDDFTDNKLNIGVKILIFVVVVAFAGGLFLFLRSFLNF